jgi:hypothetical protein
MRVQHLLARYLAGNGHGHDATACHPLGVVDNSSQLLQYDPHFTMFVEAFASWAIEELQKSNLPLSITPAGH